MSRCDECANWISRSEEVRGQTRTGRHVVVCRGCNRKMHTGWLADHPATKNSVSLRQTQEALFRQYQEEKAAEQRREDERLRVVHEIKRKEDARKSAEHIQDQRAKRYGLSRSQLALVVGDATCDICGKSDPKGGQGFCVDHCHTTGAVRGFLCGSCNTGLGMFKDSPEVMAKAIAYITSGVDFRSADAP